MFCNSNGRDVFNIKLYVDVLIENEKMAETLMMVNVIGLINANMNQATNSPDTKGPKEYVIRNTK